MAALRLRDRDAHRNLDLEEGLHWNLPQVVDHRARDPILASHRARGFTVAGLDSSLLVWLARANQFSANVLSEVSSRDTSLLQRGGVYADGDRDVLPPVSTKGRRDRGMYLRFASRNAAGSRCLIGDVATKKHKGHKG